MTLSCKVGENIRMPRDRKKEQGIFAYRRSCNYCTKRKSALFPQLNEATLFITYQVGVPFLGQSRACGTTVSFQALYVRRIPIKYGIQWEYFSPGELPRRLYERIHQSSKARKVKSRARRVFLSFQVQVQPSQLRKAQAQEHQEPLIGMKSNTGREIERWLAYLAGIINAEPTHS